MENVTFEDVVVNNAALLDTDYHTCEGVRSGVATGTTRPAPEGFWLGSGLGLGLALTLPLTTGTTLVPECFEDQALTLTLTTGTTRPVPECFEDQTASSRRAGAAAMRKRRLRRMFIGQAL